ncbi:ABC transporter permease [Embleya scabrispora]|uniref:ABC transporter permease n=1 Tax=Embleya scabrispora TaxID=159449 RepID=A0A1T3NNS6_9ACTN|nr:ABC transporter permease subunit [Embleya scabrispora]OPC78365.1 ABC transporter permease [Embleya scabrispora]
MNSTPERPRRGERAGRRYAVALGLIGLPLLIALIGPEFAGPVQPRAVSFSAGEGHWLGTDFAGRDVWRQVLLGGRSVVLVAVAATVLAYVVAVPLGLAAAATRRGWVAEALMRPLDVLIAVPSLLVVLLVAALFRPGPAELVPVIALVAMPDAARVVAAAGTEVAARPAVEALRMQGESWWRITVGYPLRAIRRTLAADAGTRLASALYLVATAAFLGVGVAPDAADWAVMVDRNRPGLFLQPWAVGVPAALIVALSMGTNLAFDTALRTPPGGRGRNDERR